MTFSFLRSSGGWMYTMANLSGSGLIVRRGAALPCQWMSDRKAETRASAFLSLNELNFSMSETMASSKCFHAHGKPFDTMALWLDSSESDATLAASFLRLRSSSSSIQLIGRDVPQSIYEPTSDYEHSPTQDEPGADRSLLPARALAGFSYLRDLSAQPRPVPAATKSRNSLFRSSNCLYLPSFSC